MDIFNIQNSGIPQKANHLPDHMQKDEEQLKQPQEIKAVPNEDIKKKEATHDLTGLKKKKTEEEFVQKVQTDKKSFSIFKLSDGKFYSQIRDLETGEITYSPELSELELYELLDLTGGIITETKA